MRALRFAMLVLLLGAASARAGGAPERAVIVVNAESWQSRLIANEYRALRKIPATHMIELSGLSNPESISVDEFREKLLAPVSKAIDDRQLTGQIEYVLYSADIPTAIQLGSDLQSAKLPQVFTPVGSVNGLTFLHQLVREKDVRYLDLQANRYARRIVTGADETAWSDADRESFTGALTELQKIARARRRPDTEKIDEAAETKTLAEIVTTLETLRKAHPQSAELLYNLACARARQKDGQELALKTLDQAVAAGFANYRHAERDIDLEALRTTDAFKALIERMKSVPLKVQPTIGFQNGGWSPRGEPVPRAEGPSYWLSTVLAVTRGRGLRVTEAVDTLKRSVAADGTRPKGTIYFEQNDDIRSTTREWGFKAAAERLEALGVKAVVERGVLPSHREDVCGAVIGIADFDWPKSGSKVLPGAICEHLTSFGGMLAAGSGQTPLTEFLRNGAAGSSGTVTEPFAIQAKFPTPFLHVHYVQGCSLAEAFYQSVSSPYQLLIVGDALCQPWTRRIEVQLAGVPDTNVLADTATLTATANSPDGVQVETFEVYVDGHRQQASPAGSFTLDTTPLDDGPHDLTILAIGSDPARTVGRLQRPVTIRNSNRTLTASCAEKEPAWDKAFAIELSASEASSIEVLNGTRQVGRLEAASGRIRVDSLMIGPGPVELQAVARYATGPAVRSEVVRVRIAPPNGG